MIGIIPAAGQATRMGGIPKMLLPIPGYHDGTLIDVLMARMRMAEPTNPPIIVSNGIVAELLEYRTGQNILYRRTTTMSQTVQCAYAFHREQEPILFGMPDTFFDDYQAFVMLKAALDDHADVAVGLFHTRVQQRAKLGMCQVECCSARDHVLAVVDKPKLTDLVWAWGVLAWKPTFWKFIQSEDPHVGYALPRAIAAGLDVRAVRMQGEYFDCGTPDEYFECIEHLRRKA